MPYKKRMKKLDLTTLDQRRGRVDLLQIYNIIDGLEDI